MTTEQLHDLISRGVPYSEASRIYPDLLKGTYLRLGGKLNAVSTPGPKPGKQAAVKLENLKNTENPDIAEQLYIAAKNLGLPERWTYLTIYRSLFGDGSATPNSYFHEAHAFAQAPYLWSKAALLGTALSSIRSFERVGKTDFEDSQIAISSVTLPQIRDLYDLFYTGPDGAKNLMNPRLYDQFDIATLAWWLMDDGTRANPGGGVRLTIGKQPHYSKEGIDSIARMILLRTGMSGHVSENDNAYRITFTGDTDVLLPYVHPNVAYKFTFRLWDPVIGSEWPPEVITESRRLFCDMPHPYIGEAEGERQLTYLVSQTRAQGYPFLTPEEVSVQDRWRQLQSSEVSVKDEGGRAILASSIHNTLPSTFFPSRSMVSSAGRKTPLQVFCNKSALRETLRKQVASGGKLQKTNIRNALAFYTGAKSAAQFNPAWARWLVTEFIGPGKSVLDICGGWGGRMVGVLSTGCSYTFIEPEPDTFEGLSKLKGALGEVVSTDTLVKGVRGRAEDPLSYKDFQGPFDMLLTCPPYYDHEKYSHHRDQSTVRFTTYHTWLQGFLRESLKNAQKLLRPNAPVIVVVGDTGKHPLVADTIRVGVSLGLELQEIVDICSTNKWDGLYRDRALVMINKGA